MYIFTILQIIVNITSFWQKLMILKYCKLQFHKILLLIINILKGSKPMILIIISVFIVNSCNYIDKNSDKIKYLKYNDKDYTNPNQKFQLPRNGAINSNEINNNKIKIALFLPIAGKYEELSRHLVNSAVMTMFENIDNSNIEIVVFDSTDDPKKAKEVFRKIIEQKIKIVIGPLFSNIIPEIADLKIDDDMIIFSISNNSKMANKNNDKISIFITAITPEAQFEKLLSFANANNNKDIILLTPDNESGAMINNIIVKIAETYDLNVFSNKKYQPNLVDIDSKINAIIADNNNFNKKNYIKNNRDAKLVIIIDSPKNTAKIVSKINSYKLKENLQIVGNIQLDDFETLNYPELIGVWFSAPDPKRFNDFEAKYQKYYHKFPPRIASVTSDLITAIAIIKQEKNLQSQIVPNYDKNITIDDFINYKNIYFPGIDGSFRFLPNGLVKRNLSILQVKKGKFEAISGNISDFRSP